MQVFLQPLDDNNKEYQLKLVPGLSDWKYLIIACVFLTLMLYAIISDIITSHETFPSGSLIFFFSLTLLGYYLCYRYFNYKMTTYRKKIILKPEDMIIEKNGNQIKLTGEHEIRSKYYTSTRKSGDSIVTTVHTILSLHLDKNRLTKIIQINGKNQDVVEVAKRIGNMFNIVAAHHTSNVSSMTSRKHDYDRIILYEPEI